MWQKIVAFFSGFLALFGIVKAIEKTAESVANKNLKKKYDKIDEKASKIDLSDDDILKGGLK